MTKNVSISGVLSALGKATAKQVPSEADLRRARLAARTEASTLKLGPAGEEVLLRLVEDLAAHHARLQRIDQLRRAPIPDEVRRWQGFVDRVVDKLTEVQEGLAHVDLRGAGMERELEAVKLRLAEWREAREGLDVAAIGADPPRKVGNPKAPSEYFYLSSASAMVSLVKLGATLKGASAAVAKCVQYLLPPSKSLAAKTLREWMRAQEMLAALPSKRRHARSATQKGPEK